MAALESRVRIQTANTNQLVFSPQDIVGCSKLSQGCDGGFPYLIAGRLVKDYINLFLVILFYLLLNYILTKIIINF